MRTSDEVVADKVVAIVVDTPTETHSEQTLPPPQREEEYCHGDEAEDMVVVEVVLMREQIHAPVMDGDVEKSPREDQIQHHHQYYHLQSSVEHDCQNVQRC